MGALLNPLNQGFHVRGASGVEGVGLWRGSSFALPGNIPCRNLFTCRDQTGSAAPAVRLFGKTPTKCRVRRQLLDCVAFKVPSTATKSSATSPRDTSALTEQSPEIRTMRTHESHKPANYHNGGITGGLKVELLDSLPFHASSQNSSAPCLIYGPRSALASTLPAIQRLSAADLLRQSALPAGRALCLRLTSSPWLVR